ncbi:MAG: DNA polymerase III subunit beta [Propionibacteriales bacterium]|nr:DNA polymerase III subunit beta [Propionibacteriales bacterium]
MKIRVERDVLAEAVAWTARSIPTRPGTLPQLSGVLITTGTDGLTMSGFDYETSARVTIPADVADAGQVLVSGRLLADISRALPNKPVDVSLDGAKLAVTCGSSRFSLQTMPVEDYPALPEMPAVVGTVDKEVFASAVSQAVTAAGRDDMLPVLTGVKIEIEGPTLSLLATDRFRLSLRELQWHPAQSDLTASALVPARVLADVAKSTSSGGELSIALGKQGAGDGLIGFESSAAGGRRRTTTRLIEGAFPNVRQLFPNTSDITALIEVATLIDSARRVALVAGRNTPIRLAFTDGMVTLEAGNGEEAQASESLEATVTGGDITIGFNPTYLLDGLGAITGSHVQMAMTQPARPAALASMCAADAAPETDFRYLLMPLRMQG